MNRIIVLASLCLGSRIVCDIGCDHGYTLIEAVLKFKVEKGIACDIAEGPLSSAMNHIKKYGLENQIETCLSNGFQNVDKEFDTAIISGMGGILISGILLQGISKIRHKKLILQANSDIYKLRKTLSQIGFKIVEEYAIEDCGKYYEILVAIEGKEEYTELDLKYGPILRKQPNEIYLKHYGNLYDRLKGIVSQIENPIQKAEKEQEIKELDEVLNR